MTKEDIIKLAREKFACQYSQLPVAESRIESFFQAAYAAGAAAERHECAKIVDGNADGCTGMTEQILRSNAAAIRARGETK